MGCCEYHGVVTPPARVLASGLGFLEAPVVLDDGRVVFCDGTRGLVLALADGADARRFQRDHGTDPRSVSGILGILGGLLG